MSDSTHKLAAVMFADIVGYTSIMSRDSEYALAIAHKIIEIQKQLVAEMKGSWVKEMGDGSMSWFNSAMDAVNCALEIQKEVNAITNEKLRIGIHLGDITIEENDVFGEGVIIASRLESIASYGGIYISEDVANAIHGLAKVEMAYLGKARLKNVDIKIGVYALQGPGLPLPGKIEKARSKFIPVVLVAVTLALVFILVNNYAGLNWMTSKPAVEKKVAVLPFENIHGDTTIQYIIDGLHEVITTNLSRVKALQITPSGSVAKYRGSELTPGEIAKELNVNYLLTASMEGKGSNIKTIVQLIDAAKDIILWGEEFDEGKTEIQDLEKQISFGTIDKLEVKAADSEVRTINKTVDVDPEVQNNLFKAWEFAEFETMTPQRLEWARGFALKSLAIDSTYAPAWYTLAKIESFFYQYGFRRDSVQKAATKKAFVNAARYGSDMEEIREARIQYLYFIEEYNDALVLEEEIYNKNPNDVSSLVFSALIHRRVGNYVIAEARFKRAGELHPESSINWYNLGQVQTRLRKYTDARTSFLNAIDNNPAFSAAYQELAQLQIDIDGDLDRADSLIDPFKYENPLPKYQISLQKRNFKLALELVRNSNKVFWIRNFYYPKKLCEAYTYYLAGNDTSQILFNQLKIIMKDSLESLPIERSAQYALGLICAGVGDFDEANTHISNLINLRNTANSKLRENSIEELLIDLYLISKQYDQAIDLIKKHLKGPYRSTDYGSCSVWDLKIHPMFDPLRNIPDFKALL